MIPDAHVKFQIWPKLGDVLIPLIIWHVIDILNYPVQAVHIIWYS